MKVLLLLVSLVLGGSARHDLHVSYGNLGVEGSTAILQIRIFKNDLEEALRRLEGGELKPMAATPEMDAAFLRYLGDRFIVQVDGAPLSGRILGSGADELDREPVWWYQVGFEAPAPFLAATVTNTILFEVFDDQRNVLRVARFPDGTRKAFYFAPGEETIEIRF